MDNGASSAHQLTQHLSLEKFGEVTTTRRAVLSQPQAIKGLGGIGKTQIAVEYAYRAREDGHYTHFLWINAASREAILSSFQTLAEQLPNFAARDEKDQHKLIAAILRWLQACSDRWLLIFDNADEPTLIQTHLPQYGRGSILLTTRASAVGWLANPIEVDQMGLVEGIQFLLHRTQRLSASDEECNEAANVVIVLDGFPLALDQAGAYIEETGCSFRDYFHLYEQHRAKLLARRGKQATNYPDSVVTTWSLSFQKIEQANPAAAELLCLCAYLSPDYIPEELLTQGAVYWPAMLQEAVTDPLRFNELLEALLAFSLIKRLAQEHMLSLHRLVQAVLLDRMGSKEQRQWAERVVCAVHTLFPTNPKEEVDTWPQCLRYLEQVQACDQLLQQHQLLLPEAADLLDRAGVYLGEHASYSLAEPLFQRALDIAEQQLGPEHLQVASSLANLGVLYARQGRYEQAEPLLQQALLIREQALGPHHPQIAYPLTNLGIIYSQQGKYEQAEPLLQQALLIREQALGPHHPQIAYPLTVLGNLQCEQGKYEQAEHLYQRALLIWEQTLGPHHPQIAYPLNNLGFLYCKQGKYEQAEHLLQRALLITEQALDLHHPQSAMILDSLGSLYCEQGQYELAEPLLQQALRIREQALGPGHPQVAEPLTNLGFLYYKQGKYEQAEPLLRQALLVTEHALGPEHKMAAYSLNGLANLYQEQGQYEQANTFYRRALMIRQRHLGLEHPEVAETLQDLARLREMQQQPDEARLLYEQALAIQQQTLGTQHPKTINTRQRLSGVLNILDKAKEVATLSLEIQLDLAKQKDEQANHQEQ